jgi:hypothetical protein
MEPVVPEEEGVAMNEGPVVEAGAGEARANEGCPGSHWAACKTRRERCVCRHRRTRETSTTKMRAAHATNTHAAAHTTAHAANVHAATTHMSAASALGEDGRRDRQSRSNRRRDDACKKPVAHLKTLLAVRWSPAAPGGSEEENAPSPSTYKCARF